MVGSDEAGPRPVAQNRRARHEYDILETLVRSAGREHMNAPSLRIW